MKSAKKKIFREFIAAQGLKLTRQRDIILSAFLALDGHIGIDEFYYQLRAKHPGIGHTTVYRTLKLFAESGIARGVRFEDGQIRYEQVSGGGHHDHMICTRCGTIEEFKSEPIEKIQSQLADSRGFLIETHKIEMYGVCAACRK